MKQIIILVFCLSALSGFAAEKQTFESGDLPVRLLELFTSEGCSSCPPADAWVSRLKTNGDLWKTIVPVVFHVDYWDQLGWPDRFAKRDFTTRQRRYAAAWGGDTVYTPALVLNGREWRDWNGAGALPASSSGKVGQLRITFDEARKIAATFIPTTRSKESLQLHIALLGANLQSKVARGENSGRVLHHEFVALTAASANMQGRDDRYLAEMTLPNEQLIDKPAALAAWVSNGEVGPPLQVTGGWLK